ncbi:recombinase family protein [Streptomyces sp. BBFR109]|uniref:recombinase family protein n=1 Tax=Streptomyces sp. BBFR109 TaxID=3448172 RepID=UPI003F772288
MTQSGVKPLLYGYMRVDQDAREGDLDQLELTFRFVAEQEGFCLATTFYEEDDGRHCAFVELVEELKRSEARHVIVPTMEHIARHRILRDSLLDQLQEETGAQVMSLDRYGNAG